MNERNAMLRVGLVGWRVAWHCSAPAHAAFGAGAGERGRGENDGIPVQSDLVRAKCGSCHRSDDKMRMSRISYRRATPENWEQTIKRMVTLNHATLEPADARNILKYLADHQGLAPEEARPIAFEAERRMIEYTYTRRQGRLRHLLVVPLDGARARRAAHERRVGTARRDASRLLPARRQPADERRSGIPPHAAAANRARADGRPPDNRHPMDKALEHLEKTLPLKTPEWSAWSADDAAAEACRALGVRRIVRPGKGAIYGQVTIDARPECAGQFTTETRYTVARSRRDVTRTGQGARLYRLPVARPRRRRQR